MDKVIKQTVNLSDIFFDEELYPRSQYSWEIAYSYSQSIRAGAKFPPIVLAVYNDKKVLVDGKHRLEAYKLLKKQEIEAEIHVGWTREKIYKEAIKYNITHGKGLSPYEKRIIAIKLMEMKCKNEEISRIIFVPLDKLDNFVGQRAVNTLTGKEISGEEYEETAREIGRRTILKSGLKQFAGQSMDEQEMESLQNVNKELGTISQLELLRQLVIIVENGMLDKGNPKVMKLVNKLKALMKKI